MESRKIVHNYQWINPRKNIIIANIYALNTGQPQYIKQILKDIKGKTKSNTKIEEYSIIPFTAMDKSPKCKISKEH